MRMIWWLTTSTATATTAATTGQRGIKGKEMDLFVTRDPGFAEKERRRYLNAITAMVIAERWLGGFDGVLDGIRDLMGVVVVWMGVGMILRLMGGYSR